MPNQDTIAKCRDAKVSHDGGNGVVAKSFPFRRELSGDPGNSTVPLDLARMAVICFASVSLRALLTDGRSLCTSQR